MPKSIRSILYKLLHPADTLHAIQLRADIRRLNQNNRSGTAAVSTGKPGPVVSLTTYGKRAQEVYLAIESIARGSVLPSRLILWLDDIDLYNNPPKELARLKQRGLEIILCKNYGPHKKYYPYVEGQETFTAPLVTADDDVIYSSTWLANLVSAHKEFPECVNCYRARVMTIREGVIVPYKEWPLCESTKPSFRTIGTGVSGIIYPSALLAALKSAGTEFETRCPKNDDLWLHVQAIRNGFKIRQIQPESIHFPIIPGSQETSLFAENVSQGDGNDRQMGLTYEVTDRALLRGAES